jgi:hypothetical protein
MPEPGDVEPEDLYNDACHEADQAREEAAFNLEAAWDQGVCKFRGRAAGRVVAGWGA